MEKNTLDDIWNIDVSAPARICRGMTLNFNHIFILRKRKRFVIFLIFQIDFIFFADFEFFGFWSRADL
jgi:hypothetical protein